MKCFVGLCYATLSLLPLSAQDTEDEIKTKRGEIVAYLKTAKTEREFRAVVMDYTRLGLKAEDLFRYELAAKLYADAEKVVRTALKDTSLAQSLAESAKKAGDVGKEYARAVKSFDRVTLKEGTPEDHLAVGKFLCFVKGAWDVGLPDLAKGSDLALKKLAEADTAGGSSPEAEVGIGDSWMGVSKKEPAAKERGVYWYKKAWPSLTGIAKEKLHTKFHEMFARGPSKGPGQLPAGWSTPAEAKARMGVDDRYAYKGKLSLSMHPGPKAIGACKPTYKIPPAGKKLLISVWVLTEGTAQDEGVLGIMYAIPGGVDTWAGVRAPADSPWWTRLEKTVQLPPNMAKFEIGSATPQIVGRIWIDELSVKTEDGVELIENGGFER